LRSSGTCTSWPAVGLTIWTPAELLIVAFCTAVVRMTETACSLVM
jgi:hypothetical protein